MGVWWVTTPATVTSNEGGWNAAGGKNAWIDQMSALKDERESATSTSGSGLLKEHRRSTKYRLLYYSR